ncbi:MULTISPECIES: hypothetical protein [Sphingopyxis]|nr:hypothetical protein [Sphingopyxis terrae]
MQSTAITLKPIGQVHGGEAISRCGSRRYIQWTENKMNLLKKAAISLAATSMLAAPIAASAQSFDSARANSELNGESKLEGSGWIIAVVALAAIIGGIIIASDNNEDSPTSP